MAMLQRMTDAEVQRCCPAGSDDGFGALETPRGRLPLAALDVQARLDGLLCHMTLSQTFVNAFAEPLEATYIFPLPDRAAVTRFRMEVGGRIIEGDLKERGQARREYTEAIEKGHRAAITEEERPGVFTLRVGNLMPGERAKVMLTIAGPLPYSDGEATFRFPLVVAPRYIPGTPLPGEGVGAGVAPDTDAVPDASRITPPVLLPGFPNPVQLSLSVDVFPSDLPLLDLRSSLHAVVEETSGKVRHIRVQPGERLDRDFILRLRHDASKLVTSLTVRPDETGGKEGTFLLTLVPPMAEAGAKPRDVVFVLDRSGSMGGWKMVAARRALGRMADTLLDRDRFTILAFDDSIETPPGFSGLTVASDRQRFRALEFLAKIESRGGTEMAQPLEQAVALLEKSERDRERILVLVTDGQVGNEDQILKSLAKRLKGLRVFTLGIDQAVNAAFLKRLADFGGGACELVESEDRLDEVMDQVHRRIGQPVLTGLKLEPAGLRIDPASLVPDRLPDVFAGAPVQIFGRWSGAPGGIAVQAADPAGKLWQTTVPSAPCDNPALTAAWARGQVRKLEDRYVIARDETLEKQIVETSLRYKVLSRFTAYVAVDRSEVVNVGGEGKQIVQPVEMPAGWEVEAFAGGMAIACSAAPAALTGSFLAGASDAAHYEMADDMECMLSDSGAEEQTFSRRKSEHPNKAAKKAKRPQQSFASRVQDLLDTMALHSNDAGSIRRQTLLRLVLDLERLLKAMEAAGEHPPEMDRLAVLLEELQGDLSDDAVVNRLWVELEEALKAFVLTSRERFWA